MYDSIQEGNLKVLDLIYCIVHGDQLHTKIKLFCKKLDELDKFEGDFGC